MLLLIFVEITNSLVVTNRKVYKVLILFFIMTTISEIFAHIPSGDFEKFGRARVGLFNNAMLETTYRFEREIVRAPGLRGFLGKKVSNDAGYEDAIWRMEGLKEEPVMGMYERVGGRIISTLNPGIKMIKDGTVLVRSFYDFMRDEEDQPFDKPYQFAEQIEIEATRKAMEQVALHQTAEGKIEAALKGLVVFHEPVRRLEVDCIQPGQ